MLSGLPIWRAKFSGSTSELTVSGRKLSPLGLSSSNSLRVSKAMYVSVPIAAGALYPLFGILLSPAIGAAAMALSSVSVIANALRLRRAVL